MQGHKARSGLSSLWEEGQPQPESQAFRLLVLFAALQGETDSLSQWTWVALCWTRWWGRWGLGRHWTFIWKVKTQKLCCIMGKLLLFNFFTFCISGFFVHALPTLPWVWTWFWGWLRLWPSWSSSHSCMRMKGSLPFWVSLLQGLGRDSMSLTLPWESPSTCTTQLWVNILGQNRILLTPTMHMSPHWRKNQRNIWPQRYTFNKKPLEGSIAPRMLCCVASPLRYTCSSFHFEEKRFMHWSFWTDTDGCLSCDSLRTVSRHETTGKIFALVFTEWKIIPRTRMCQKSFTLSNCFPVCHVGETEYEYFSLKGIHRRTEI